MKKLFFILIFLISVVGFSQQWVNVTPNQISNGWGAAYNTSNQLIIYYQFWRVESYSKTYSYEYHVYFYSGYTNNSVILKNVQFSTDGYNVGSLATVLVPSKALEVYIIYSNNPTATIRFTWQNSMLY